MEKLENWDNITTTNYYNEKLKLGGHICKILKVGIEKVLSKKTGNELNFLKLEIDIETPDEQAGFYRRKFESDTQANALEAKWKGYYRLLIPTNDSEEIIKSNFKSFITSIERSNSGYKWNWEEKTLVGKIFGGVFGLEEFIAADGRKIAFARCRFIRSVDKIEEVPIPKVKLANKTFMDYKEYLKMKENEKLHTELNNGSEISQVSDLSVLESTDDLPF